MKTYEVTTPSHVVRWDSEDAATLAGQVFGEGAILSPYMWEVRNEAGTVLGFIREWTRL